MSKYNMLYRTEIGEWRDNGHDLRWHSHAAHTGKNIVDCEPVFRDMLTVLNKAGFSGMESLPFQVDIIPVIQCDTKRVDWPLTHPFIQGESSQRNKEEAIRVVTDLALALNLVPEDHVLIIVEDTYNEGGEFPVFLVTVPKGSLICEDVYNEPLEEMILEVDWYQGTPLEVSFPLESRIWKDREWKPLSKLRTVEREWEPSY